MKSFSVLILLFLVGLLPTSPRPREAVLLVSKPFVGLGQPESRHRLERTMNPPVEMPIDNSGLAPGNLLGSYQASVSGKVVGRGGELHNWFQSIPEAIPSNRTLPIVIEIHQRLPAWLRLGS